MFCQPGFEFFRQHLALNLGNYLEIGVFNGDSVAALARAYPDLQVFAVDPFIEDGCTTHTTGVAESESMPQQRETTLANIRDLSNVYLFEMTSSDFALTIQDDMLPDMNIAYVLIDGSHHYEDVRQDVDLAMRLIGSRPGYIVFDDVTLPGVAQAYREFLQVYAGRYAPAQDLYDLHPGNILAHAITPE